MGYKNSSEKLVLKGFILVKLSKFIMKFFTDCSGDCKTCAAFYIDANCLAGHGDDCYTEADISDVKKLYEAKVTSHGRVLAQHELEYLKNWLEEKEKIKSLTDKLE